MQGADVDSGRREQVRPSGWAPVVFYPACAFLINGSHFPFRPKTGFGLSPEIYAGVLVWNRVRMLKDPDTGKRVSRPNGVADVQRVPAPHLRIVDDDTWRAVQVLKAQRAHTPAHRQRRPKTLLSGLLRCGYCGAGMVLHDRDHGRARLRCSAVRESGTCTNARRVYLDDIERRVVAGLAEALRAPRYFAKFVEEYNAERRCLAGVASAARAKLDRRAAEIKRELDRAVEAIIKGLVDPETLRTRIKELETERDRLKAELAAAAQAPVLTLHPGAINAYGRTLDDLATALASSAGSGDPEVINKFRALVQAVIVTPLDKATSHAVRVEIEIKGRLAALTGIPAFPDRFQCGDSVGSGGGTRTPDTRIMIPLL